jgi:3-hydroxyisobutyrate dehydrogenase-like beta-hydroxyacid dehydrogenase
LTKVAVVGLGAMGSRMAGRLIAAGNEVVVWNRDNTKTVPLTQSGATAAETPAAAARRADVVITMVSNPAALRAVTEGKDGVVAGAGDGSAIVQMSTVGPAPVLQLASALPSGIGLLDAPVLGSIAEAEAGTLHIFVGGDDEPVERWGPLLSTLGQAHHVGPVGAGSAAKLVANSTLVGIIGVLGEALALARTLGLPDKIAFDVLATTALEGQAERRRDSVESGEYPPRFALSLAKKDADLILETAPNADLRLMRAAQT